MTLDELLNAATQLSEPDLETPVSQMLLLRARRRSLNRPLARIS